MTLIEELLADELPGDRQYQREARIVLAGLLHRAAVRIRELEDAIYEAKTEWKLGDALPHLERVCPGSKKTV